jgi:hypothetical protein
MKRLADDSMQCFQAFTHSVRSVALTPFDERIVVERGVQLLRLQLEAIERFQAEWR